MIINEVKGGRINCICALGDEITYATSGTDMSIKIWSLNYSSPIQELKNHHSGSINYIFYSKEPKLYGYNEYLFSGGDDSKLKVYDIKNYSMLKELQANSQIYKFTYLYGSKKHLLAFCNGFNDKIVLVEIPKVSAIDSTVSPG